MPSLPQKICKACLTAFFILILNITAVRAEELYLEPVIQGNILDETIPVLQKGGRNYIDFEPFAAALQMKVSRQPGNITVIFMGQKTNIPASSLSAENHLIEAGHYYFEQTYLENLLDVRLKINRLDMQLEIDADKELPVTQKLRALSNRQQIMPYPQYDSFNNYEFDNRFISTPIADFTLQHNYNIRDYNGRNEQRRNSTYYQIDSGMLAGGFDLYTSIFGDSENNSYNPRARITLGRTFLDEPKNALNLVSFEAGDVTGVTSTLFNNSANGRGLLASSFKDLVLSADKTIDISGPISSGWDVELYLNNQLIAFRQPGVNGRYMHWGGADAKTAKASVSFKLNTMNDHKHLEVKYVCNEDMMEYPITLEVTRPNYGGLRWWFRCPCCGERVADLYIKKRFFCCRKCNNLSYRSQQYSFYDRMRLMSDKYERIASENGLKKKWMHWNTYERLMDKVEYYDNMSLGSLQKMLWKLITS